MLYPLFFDLSGRTVVVVGGGVVGRRRAAKLRESGAIVRIVDPKPRPDDLPNDVAWVEHPFAPQHLGQVALAFACATPAVNREVADAARGLGIPVNSASEPSEGDFQVPAVFTDGLLQIAVSTGGAGPAAAKRIRDRVAERFEGVFAAWLKLQAELRPIILEGVADDERRKALFLGLASDETLERVQDGRAEEVRAGILRELSPAGPRIK